MFQLNLNSLQPGRTFCELRFKEVFSLPEQKFKLADKLSKKYPEVIMNQADQVVFIDQIRKIQIVVQINRILIEWSETPSLIEFSKVANSIITTVKNTLGISEIKRIGVRTYLNLNVQGPEEAYNYIVNRYIHPKLINNINLITDEILNPQVSFSGRKGSLFFNLILNYQLEQIIEGQLTKPIVQKLNNYLTVDLDLYKQGNINKIDKFFDEIVAFSEKIPDFLRNIER